MPEGRFIQATVVYTQRYCCKLLSFVSNGGRSLIQQDIFDASKSHIIGMDLHLFVPKHIFLYIKWCVGIIKNKSCNFSKIFRWSSAILNTKKVSDFIKLKESEHVLTIQVNQLSKLPFVLNIRCLCGIWMVRQSCGLQPWDVSLEWSNTTVSPWGRRNYVF